LEGIEHTCVRAAYLLSNDIELCVGVLRQPDTSLVPLSFTQKIRELLMFAVSDENAELRQRMGTGVGSP
jgi:hypothetical protein